MADDMRIGRVEPRHALGNSRGRRQSVQRSASSEASEGESLMSAETVIISAIVGIVTSAITAYITTRFKMKEEKTKWRRELR